MRWKFELTELPRARNVDMLSCSTMCCVPAFCVMELLQKTNLVHTIFLRHSSWFWNTCTNLLFFVTSSLANLILWRPQLWCLSAAQRFGLGAFALLAVAEPFGFCCMCRICCIINYFSVNYCINQLSNRINLLWIGIICYEWHLSVRNCLIAFTSQWIALGGLIGQWIILLG